MLEAVRPRTSLIYYPQGFAILPEGGVTLISQVIQSELGLPVSVLMGANLANEVYYRYMVYWIKEINTYLQ